MFIKLGNTQAGGFDEPLLIENYEPPSTDLRTNYVDRPHADGQLVGKDYLGSTNHAFDLVTNRSNLAEAYEVARNLERVWKSSDTRMASNVPVALSYSFDEVNWRRFYGRPGAWTGFTPDVLARLGVGRITADFTQTRVEYFDEAEKLETITYAVPTQGGLISPLISPLVSAGTGATRSGFINNAGDLPTPLTVKFYGPITNPVLRAEGWEVSYRGSIAYDQEITIDPLLGTVIDNRGVNRAGNLGTRVQLSKVVLPVGQSEVHLSGVDPTGTSRVELRWRNAYRSMW